MTTKDTRIMLVVFSLCVTTAALGRYAPTVRWGHQLVTPTDDVPRAAVADGNDGIYVTVQKKSKYRVEQRLDFK